MAVGKHTWTCNAGGVCPFGFLRVSMLLYTKEKNWKDAHESVSSYSSEITGKSGGKSRFNFHIFIHVVIVFIIHIALEKTT